MAGVVKAGATIFWILVAVAIFSRLASTPEVPKLIRDGATAVQRLFNGAFGV